jgi:hypothetical protein
MNNTMADVEAPVVGEALVAAVETPVVGEALVAAVETPVIGEALVVGEALAADVEAPVVGETPSLKRKAPEPRSCVFCGRVLREPSGQLCIKSEGRVCGSCLADKCYPFGVSEVSFHHLGTNATYACTCGEKHPLTDVVWRAQEEELEQLVEEGEVSCPHCKQTPCSLGHLVECKKRPLTCPMCESTYPYSMMQQHLKQCFKKPF